MAGSVKSDNMTIEVNDDFETGLFGKFLKNNLKEDDLMMDFRHTGLGKHDIVIPKPLKGAVSLSDIIAATIGEEARSCDMATANQIPDDSFDFLQSICEEPHGHGTTSNAECDDNANTSNQENLMLKTNNDCFLTSENSTNSCDVLSTFQQQNQPLNTAQFNSSEKIGTDDPPFSITTDLAFDSQINFLSPNFGQLSAENCAHMKASNLMGAVSSTMTTDFKPNQASDDSDLEDSMHFVDPDDRDNNDLLNTPVTHLADNKSNNKADDDCLEPKAKKPRLSEIDTNSCPLFANNDYLSDCNPQFLAFLNGIDGNEDVSNKTGFGCHNFYPMKTPRGRSFSGNPIIGLARPKPRARLNDKCCKLTPKNLLRTRSFSEACNRPQTSPTLQNNLNSTFTSLLHSPEQESLSQNPMFDDLKSTLLTDCQSLDCPQSLFDTLSAGPKQDVYARERCLQSKFSSLQAKYPEEVCTLSTFYHKQSAEVETERLNEIHDENLPKSFRKHLNSYYDDQLHKIMDRVEKSLGLLSTAMKDISSTSRQCRPRTQFSRKAVEMMEEWLLRNYEHPYPSATAIEALAKAGDLTVEQVKKWFANKRNRSKINKPTSDSLGGMRRKRQFSARW